MKLSYKRVLFLNYAAIGHINAQLPLCNLLKNKGYDVYICSYYSVKEYVLSQRLKFYQMNTYPFAANHEKDININSKTKYLDELIDRFTNRLYVQRSREIKQMINELKPSIVFIDVFLSTDFIVLYSIAKEYNIKICFINTALSSYYMKMDNLISAPLFSASTDPKQIAKEWNIFFTNRKLSLLLEKIIYFGKNNLSLIKEKIFATNMSSKYSIDMKKTFHIGFNNVPELVLSPFILEYNNFIHRDKQFYVNLKIKENRIELDNREFNSRKKYFLEQKNIGRKIIYCSFGTIIEASDFSYRLISMLIEMSDREPNYIFIVTFSQKIELEKNINNNIFIYDKLPQLDILRMSNLFVTHGGWNSIKESIHFSVPLVVCPTEFMWDHNNSARIVEKLKIGVKIDIKNITFEKFITCIEYVLTSSCQDNIEKLNKQISSTLNEQETLQHIENLPCLD